MWQFQPDAWATEPLGCVSNSRIKDSIFDCYITDPIPSNSLELYILIISNVLSVFQFFSFFFLFFFARWLEMTVGGEVSKVRCCERNNASGFLYEDPLQTLRSTLCEHGISRLSRFRYNSWSRLAMALFDLSGVLRLAGSWSSGGGRYLALPPYFLLMWVLLLRLDLTNPSQTCALRWNQSIKSRTQATLFFFF